MHGKMILSLVRIPIHRISTLIIEILSLLAISILMTFPSMNLTMITAGALTRMKFHYAILMSINEKSQPLLSFLVVMALFIIDCVGRINTDKKEIQQAIDDERVPKLYKFSDV